MGYKFRRLSHLAALESVEVIGSALVLLETCESPTSSTSDLHNQLLELARRYVDVCDKLALVPVVDPPHQHHTPL